MAGTTSVAFVSDHRMLRDLLSLALDREDDLRLIGTAATAAEGGRLVRETHPAVVLLDHPLPDCDVITLAAALTDQHPDSRLVLMADSWDAGLVHRAVLAGATGVVARSSALDGVLGVLRAARAGSVVVDRAILLQLTGTERRATGGRTPLSPREHEVLRLLSLGKDMRAIAKELRISHNTCRGYLKSTRTKLQAHSQLEIVLAARRLGLVPDPGPHGVAGPPGDPVRSTVDRVG